MTDQLPQLDRSKGLSTIRTLEGGERLKFLRALEEGERLQFLGPTNKTFSIVASFQGCKRLELLGSRREHLDAVLGPLQGGERFQLLGALGKHFDIVGPLQGGERLELLGSLSKAVDGLGAGKDLIVGGNWGGDGFAD